LRNFILGTLVQVFMFSDRSYFAKLIVPATIVWALSYAHYCANRGYNPSFWECQAAPEWFDGERLRIFKAKVTRVFPGGIEISTHGGGHRIRCQGETSGVREGDTVSCLATFHKENYLEIHRIRVMHNWHTKRLIIQVASLFAFVGCFVWLLCCFRTRLYGGIFQPEQHGG